ncbi:MAG: hypothetical protein EXR11_12390 [Rhodospirillaceae bacterium]|nr:hypothetical protein [Rhodospirillaceae bacterium]
MAHSLEIRVPFVDHTLFTTLAPFLTGPTQLTKADMVGTLRSPLRDSIVHRPKTGVTVPVHDWLTTTHTNRDKSAQRGLRGWAQAVLAHHMNH